MVGTAEAVMREVRSAALLEVWAEAVALGVALELAVEAAAEMAEAR